MIPAPALISTLRPSQRSSHTPHSGLMKTHPLAWLSGHVIALACVLAGLLPSVTVAQSGDEAKAITAFKRSLHQLTEHLTEADHEARSQALYGLEGFDSEKVAKALVDGHVALELGMDSVSIGRAELLAEIAMLQKGQEFAEKRTFPKAVSERIEHIRTKLRVDREAIDAMRELHAQIRDRIVKLKDPQAVRWLVKGVLGGKRHSMLLKLAVSRVAGMGPTDEVLAELVRVFKKARRPSELIALLEGVGAAGKDAQEVTPQVIKLFEHKEAAVRERAAIAAAKLASPDAVEPMIDLLEREEGRTQEMVAAALEMLTRQKHGVLVQSWRRWYADEKVRIEAGEAPLGGGMFERRTQKKDMGYYFDIAMEGKSILYIIDASGSMKEEIELRLKSAKGDAEPVKQSRLEACKGELIGALGRLEKDAEFNLLWYNDLPHLYSPKMLQATKPAISTAQDYIRQLTPNSSTNIYDSLKVAFELAGQGSKDKYYGVNMDTIFLLTDGSPTKPDGKADSTQKILDAVRDWNALKRITIHAIGIGRGINTGFLQQLASENNGEFRQY